VDDANLEEIVTIAENCQRIQIEQLRRSQRSPLNLDFLAIPAIFGNFLQGAL